LESISVLSLSKSFLGVDEEDLQTWGTEFYRVRGEREADNGERLTLEVVSQSAPKKQKACFANDVRVQISSLIGQLPTVAFLPQDLQLFTSSPSERRRFFDQLLCQVSPEYFQALYEYQKIIKQRNALLKLIAKKQANPEDLDPWDARAAERGSIITLHRLELIETFALTLTQEVQALGENWQDTKLEFERTGSARTRKELEQEFRQELFDNRQKDVILQSTTAGPHREDWQFIADGHSLPSFGSRGQQRIAVLALLFLQASYLELRRGEKPIILLDDIFSELDDRHQESILKSFTGHQVLMTGVYVPPGLQDAKVWEVRKGEVVQMAVS
jgi:DNA replication and repair protein RecF